MLAQSANPYTLAKAAHLQLFIDLSGVVHVAAEHLDLVPGYLGARLQTFASAAHQHIPSTGLDIFSLCPHA